jgi:hypothetical protein
VTTARPDEEKNKKKDREREWRKEWKPGIKSRTDDFGIWKPETITSYRKLFIHKV